MEAPIALPRPEKGTVNETWTCFAVTARARRYNQPRRPAWRPRGAARARLQSHARDEYHKRPTAPGCYEGIVLAAMCPISRRRAALHGSNSHQGRSRTESPPNSARSPNTAISRRVNGSAERFYTTKIPFLTWQYLPNEIQRLPAPICAMASISTITAGSARAAT
jgi:hypothetical protein